MKRKTVNVFPFYLFFSLLQKSSQRLLQKSKYINTKMQTHTYSELVCARSFDLASFVWQHMVQLHSATHSEVNFVLPHLIVLIYAPLSPCSPSQFHLLISPYHNIRARSSGMKFTQCLAHGALPAPHVLLLQAAIKLQQLPQKNLSDCAACCQAALQH